MWGLTKARPSLSRHTVFFSSGPTARIGLASSYPRTYTGTGACPRLRRNMTGPESAAWTTESSARRRMARSCRTKASAMSPSRLFASSLSMQMGSLLELPLVIKRQLGDCPRLLITEQILLSLLSSGLPRLAYLGNAPASENHQEAAADADRRLTAIESGERLCGGMMAWGKIVSHTGDQAFLRFLDHWIDFKLADGTVDSLKDYWIYGKSTVHRAPRWCIARDVLGWID